MKKIVLFLSILALIFTGRLYSQVVWPDNPSSNVIVDSTIGTAYNDTLTTDGAGGAIVAWKDNRFGNFNVFVQKLDSLGNIKWMEHGLQVSNLPGDADNINIVPDSIGGAAISWAEGDSIFLQRVYSNGNLKWGMNGLFVDKVISLKRLKMVKVDSLSSVLYWISKGIMKDTLFAQFVDSTGVIRWAPKALVAVDSAIVNFTALRDTNGSSFIAWAVLNDANKYIRINKILKTGATAWGDSGVIVSGTGTNMGGMSIVSDGAGGVYFVWQHNDAGEKVKALRFNSAGAQVPWSVPVVITTTATAFGDNNYPHAISDGAGGIIVAWVDYRNGIHYQIYAQRLNNTGTQIWTSGGTPVCVFPQNQEKIALMSDGAGGAVIVWKDYRIPNSGVYAQRVNNGAPLWRNDGVPISVNGYHLYTVPKIISDGKGNYIISWMNNDNIYVRKVWSNGLMFPGKVIKGGMPVNLAGDPGDTLIVPINLTSSILSSDSLFSYQFVLSVDSSVLKIIGFDTTSTLIGGSTLDTSFTISGLNQIARFAGAKAYPIIGSGNLIKIKYKVNNFLTWGDSATLHIDSVMFNEGKPLVPEISPGFFAGMYKLFGDITGNKVIDGLDASEILKFVVFKANAIGTDTIKKKIADVSGNNMIMAYDAALVLRRSVNLILHFPAGDTLYAWGIAGGMPRTAPVSNSKAEIIANLVRTETDVTIPIELKNINNVLSSDIAISYNDGLVEFIGYNTTEVSKDFQVITNYKDGILYVSMVSVKGMSKDGKLIELRFRANGEKFDVQFVSFVLNEEEFAISSELTSNLPKSYSLHQNYPNPFNPETVIKFDLPKSSDVILKIYNVLGQEIRTLVNERKPAGYHSVKWDSRNSNGVLVSSGVYLYKLQAGDYILTKKMILIR